MSKRRQWRKNLYENYDYEDNYTDPTFLKDLRTNLHVRFYSLGEVIRGITVLNNQISCITGFLIIFYMLYSDKVSPSSIFWPSFTVTIMGYICFRGKMLTFSMAIEDSKTLLTVLLFGYLLAPVLHTLTDAISTDTIFSMTFIVMLINVLFCDYGLSVAMVSKAISVNAAIFGSICLASRLATSYHAFVLLVEAAIFFVLYPMVVREYWCSYFFLPIFIVDLYFLWTISLNVLWIYVSLTLFINFVCPCIFVIQQRHKHNIHGPWDEAIVEETTDDNIDIKL
ncbi:phosphatidylinositol N-acetylglucosaminyltransferase subunit C [Stomoxys calcitrans]|uniref:Phosphatidylinositol N-acetylglucosaminyltransferase subunit C n=1 Tax=Stomoxys calcitrans TaxID=35570 RepID=A0A1I8PJ59_STOCA|nr:phosphatidylinositol N-acetylglucosaminyltransferase subunit C [Stomoxys calcitrans]